MKPMKFVQLGIAAFLLVVTTPPTQGSFICDTPPACQCECLDKWDECAEGLPIDDARKKCDPAYNKCYENNCTPR